MSTLVTSVILLTITIAVPLFFISRSIRSARKRNQENLNLFILAGSNHGLSFSKYELLKNKMIGFDNLHQALLIYEFEGANTIRLDMKEVTNCTVNKEFDSIVMGNDKKAKTEKHLSNIDLKFGFKRATAPTSISFYNSSVNSIYEMAELETKAKEWETLLSKVLVRELKQLA